MHMADALLSPVVGGSMWAVSAGAIAYSSVQRGKQIDDRKAPLMGVLGAFIFAAQMINFSIPGTGASGHITGSLLLAILLGPHAAFLTMASVLVVQALFFADGGVLALGCNIFNLGFIPAFIVLPLCYRGLIGKRPDSRRGVAVTFLSALLALQLGSLAVVVETVLSGVSSLPFAAFVSVMQPIHLAIGIMEGAATVAVLSFVRKARPEILTDPAADPRGGRWLRSVGGGLVAATLFAAAFLTWYASENPDGLEWAIAKVTGEAGVPARKGGIHDALAVMQTKSGLFPDYELKGEGLPLLNSAGTDQLTNNRIRTSVAGLAGAILTLLVALCAGFFLKRKSHHAG